MGFWISLLALLALVIFGSVGANVSGLDYFIGVILPYAAIAIFLIGIIARVVKWARSPVPFKITTTAGQARSLDFIHQNKLDSPFTSLGTIGRMLLEVLFFRSLFRNTRADIKGEKLVYGDEKLLWLFSIIFHYSFLIIILRHFRFFVEPIPGFVESLQTLDEFMQLGVPNIYITDVLFIAGISYLLLRRILDARVRYISLSSDYFPLLLISGIAVTGIMMRYFTKTDLIGIKDLTMGILSFGPQLPADMSAVFFVHFFLVCTLLIYFPFSKLVHAPGVFMSPTRNMANNNRAVRHVNPWNDEFKLQYHTYMEYEDEFRPLMKAAGLPLEKEPEEQDGN